MRKMAAGGPAMPDRFAERIRRRLADACAEAAELSGDGRFARAAGALRGGRGGRPAADDAEPLALARAYFEGGVVPSRRAACRRAAFLYAQDRESRDRLTRRLQKKMLQK